MLAAAAREVLLFVPEVERELSLEAMIRNLAAAAVAAVVAVAEAIASLPS